MDVDPSYDRWCEGGAIKPDLTDQLLTEWQNFDNDPVNIERGHRRLRESDPPRFRNYRRYYEERRAREARIRSDGVAQ